MVLQNRKQLAICIARIVPFDSLFAVPVPFIFVCYVNVNTFTFTYIHYIQRLYGYIACEVIVLFSLYCLNKLILLPV